MSNPIFLQLHKRCPTPCPHVVTLPVQGSQGRAPRLGVPRSKSAAHNISSTDMRGSGPKIHPGVPRACREAATLNSLRGAVWTPGGHCDEPMFVAARGQRWSWQ